MPPRSPASQIERSTATHPGCGAPLILNSWQRPRVDRQPLPSYGLTGQNGRTPPPAVFSFRRARQQIGALPYRVTATGDLEVLLITSRHSKRWVIPKGNLMADRRWPDAAAQEAYEEAGVLGQISPVAIGRYRYLKQRRFGLPRQCIVSVFPLDVARQLEEWPEKAERELRWTSTEVAARLVSDRELGRMIARFRHDRLHPERMRAFFWRRRPEPDRLLRSFAAHGRQLFSSALCRRTGA